MNLTFKGKSAIVTGACGGMGLEVSKNLSNNQILVLMIDLKEPPKNFLKNKFIRPPKATIILDNQTQIIKGFVWYLIL